MFKKYILLFAFIILTFSQVWSQNIEEEVYLHVNASNFVSGETLLFSAFVYSKKTNQPSMLSSILYVELVNSEGKVAHQLKISLENGRGYGDIFIPSMYSTGAYHLIAYTRWMKNFDSTFKVPIFVINPFEKFNPQPQEIQDWQMNFFTSKDGILLDQQNTVSFRAINAQGAGADFKGKIVDENGELVLNFSPQEYGIGQFIFTPKSTSSYQAILEDVSGQFHFFNLPPVQKQGSKLLLTETKMAYELNVGSTYEYFEGLLKVTGKNHEILNQTVVNGSGQIIPKSTLKPGLYQANLIYKEEIVDSRFIFIPFKRENIAETEKTYKRRSLVQISKDLDPGKFSVSVRKIQDEIMNLRPSSKEYNHLYFALPDYFNLWMESIEPSKVNPLVLNTILNIQKIKPSHPYSDEVKYLPDYRGELIDGMLKDSRHMPIKNELVMYSSLGENFLSIATTDETGKFSMNIAPLNEEKEAFISLLDTGEYKVTVESNFIKSHPKYEVPNLNLDSLTVAQIIKRSVHSQIENAYFEIKKDSSFHAVDPKEIFSEFQYFYLLDDYNRFPSIRETFIEYMPAIAVKQRHGKPFINIRSGEYRPHFNEPPLILLDGVPVDVESLYAFSPYKIKSVGVIGQRYFLGPKIFDGVLSLHTFDGNLHDFKINENILRFKYQGVQPKKIFYQTDYSNPSLDRIPDRREQLIWIPETISDNGTIEFEFYTSDVTGKYEIVIEGFSQEGHPISKKEVFEVIE